MYGWAGRIGPHEDKTNEELCATELKAPEKTGALQKLHQFEGVRTSRRLL